MGRPAIEELYCEEDLGSEGNWVGRLIGWLEGWSEVLLTTFSMSWFRTELIGSLSYPV